MNGATKRDFASLLDELLVDSQIEEQSAPPSTAAFDPLSVAAELLSGRIKVSDDQAAAEYRDTASDLDALFEAVTAAKLSDAAAVEEPALPPVEPAAISRELGIKPSTSLSHLARIRRDFAFKNHPDRVAPHLRQHAMVRMQVANMLIDDARRAAQRGGRT